MTTMLVVFVIVSIIVSLLSWASGFYLGKACGIRETRHYLDEQWREYEAFRDLVFKELGIEVNVDVESRSAVIDITDMPDYDGMEYEELVVAAQYMWMENARLRESAERDADVMESLNLSLEEAQAENAKLRKFATLAWQLLKRNEPNFVWQDMVEGASELGIEVKDD